ncbi:unnamed protein product [Arabidopsis thaliana]|uniref:(thale cress) hypothetical protein n=1 Tax=Arabidopsis thaliana TaxID=3702 RepID=A0A7G2EN20_ARATH|nr:unnamed protein product [Arabidopsis thaliana]
MVVTRSHVGESKDNGKEVEIAEPIESLILWLEELVAKQNKAMMRPMSDMMGAISRSTSHKLHDEQSTRDWILPRSSTSTDDRSGHPDYRRENRYDQVRYDAHQHYDNLTRLGKIDIPRLDDRHILVKYTANSIARSGHGFRSSVVWLHDIKEGPMREVKTQKLQKLQDDQIQLAMLYVQEVAEDDEIGSEDERVIETVNTLTKDLENESIVRRKKILPTDEVILPTTIVGGSTGTLPPDANATTKSNLLNGDSSHSAEAKLAAKAAKDQRVSEANPTAPPTVHSISVSSLFSKPVKSKNFFSAFGNATNQAELIKTLSKQHFNVCVCPPLTQMYISPLDLMSSRSQ